MSSTVSIYPLPGRKRKSVPRRNAGQKFARSSSGGSISKKMSNRIVPSAHVHSFHRTMETQVYCTSAGLQFGSLSSLFYSLQFNMQGVIYLNGASGTVTESVPGFAELSGLFDEIMLSSVKVEIRAMGSSLASGSVIGNSVIIGQAIDYNDALCPTTANSLREYESYKTVAINENGLSPHLLTS